MGQSFAPGPNMRAAPEKRIDSRQQSNCRSEGDCAGAFGKNRGDCPDFEPARVLTPFAGPFMGPVEPFILEADRLVRAAG